MTRRVLGLAVVLAMVLIGGTAEAQDTKRGCRGTEMWLELVNTKWHRTTIQPPSGWQVTALLEAKECLLEGIGVSSYPPVFPGADRRPVYIVLGDPDHCPSFIEPGAQLNVHYATYCDGPPSLDYPDCDPPDWRSELQSLYGNPCLQAYPPGATEILTWERDETWLEVTPGRSIAAEDDDEVGPLVWGITPSREWALMQMGPDLGSTTDDVRYGSWRRMPGLVVLADHGPGLLTVNPDPTQPPSDLDNPTPGPVPSGFFDPQTPVEAWNLAGHFNSAAYSLMGGDRKTTALAHLNVPYYLLTPVVLVDKHISYPILDDSGVLCESGDSLYRMDGGPLTCYDGMLTIISGLLNQTVVTLRVFAVDGEAPDKLIDMNSDGRIDIRDARLMGLHPITKEAVSTFTQAHSIECGVLFDFDGDGDPGGCGAGARPGGITRPPR